MMNHHPPKTLQMLIREQWLEESIKDLGSGYGTHLSYLNQEIDPKVLQDTQNLSSGEVLGEIIKLGETANSLVAVAELVKVHDFKSFIRFDLRLLEVAPFIVKPPVKVDSIIEKSDYLCYYR